MATAAQPFPGSQQTTPRSRQLSVPPHSRDAEQAVLGGLMLVDSRRLVRRFRCAAQLEDFYFPEHRQIFEAIARAGQARANPSMCSPWPTRTDFARGKLDAAGGRRLSWRSCRKRPRHGESAALRRDHSRPGRSCASLITAGNKIIDNCYNTDGAPVEDVLDQAERRIFGIADDRPKDNDGPEELKYHWWARPSSELKS